MSYRDLDDDGLRALLDGPVGSTAHLGPFAKRLAGRRRRQRRSRFAASAVFLIIGTASAYSLLPSDDMLRGGGYASARPSVGQVADVAATRTLLGMDVDGLARTHRALAVDCLRSAGVQVPATPEPEEADRSTSPWFAPSGGNYGIGAETANGGVQPAPADYEAVLYGKPPQEVVIPIENGGSVTAPVGGCFGSATAELYGGPAEAYERAYQAVRALPEAAVALSREDQPVREAVKRWSSCMAEQDWDVQTPDELENALLPELRAGDDQALREREVALYDADIACRSESMLQIAFDDAFVRQGTDLAAAHEEALRGFRRMLDHAHAIAADR